MLGNPVFFEITFENEALLTLGANEMLHLNMHHDMSKDVLLAIENFVASFEFTLELMKSLLVLGVENFPMPVDF